MPLVHWHRYPHAVESGHSGQTYSEGWGLSSSTPPAKEARFCLFTGSRVCYTCQFCRPGVCRKFLRDRLGHAVDLQLPSATEVPAPGNRHRQGSIWTLRIWCWPWQPAHRHHESRVGGGVGVVVTPLLALVIPAKLALGVMLPLSLAADLIAIRFYWKYRVARSPSFCFPEWRSGCWLAGVLLDVIPELWFRRMLGGLACLFGCCRPSETACRPLPPSLVWLPGFAAGCRFGTYPFRRHHSDVVI